jgi:hypothetical protein
VKVEIGGTDAYTDGKVIRLPSLPGDVPDTILAMARGYLDHEAGHVRDTDFQALKDAALTPLEKHVWNTLEDWRVEQKLASMFPGCRLNFDWLITHVFGSQAHDEPAQPAAIILNWLLLEVRSWDVQALSSRRDILAGQVDTVYPGIRAKIGRVLNAVRTMCRSTQDAIDFAREIVRVLDQFANPAVQPESADQVDPKDPHSQGGEETSAPTSAGGEKSEDDQQKQENPLETGGDSADEENQDGSPVGDYSLSSDQKDASGNDGLDELGEFGEDGQKHLQDLLGAGADDLPQNLGDILADALQVTSRQSLDNTVTVAISTPKIAAPLTEADVLEARQASMALRTRLHPGTSFKR